MGKKSKPPPAPDYTALAKQTADSQNQQLAAQTVANRPDQYNPYGSVKWSQDPSGKWTQTTSLNPAEQELLDSNRSINLGLNKTAGGLLGQAQESLSKPLTAEGLPEWSGYDPSKLQDVDLSKLTQGLPDMGGYDTGALGEYGSFDPSTLSGFGKAPTAGLFGLDPFGNSKEIQDATYSLLSPYRQREREGEIQRLKNQGLTEDSPAFQRAIERLDQGDTDAQLKSLLAGTTEYGNAFNRGLNKSQLNFGQGMSVAELSDSQRAQMAQEQLAQAGLLNQIRGQQFGEQGAIANLADRQNDQQFGQNQAGLSLAAALRGQQFGEQGAMAGLTAQQRAQMLQEAQMLRQSPLNDLRNLMGQAPETPDFTGFATSGQGQGTDFLGAGTNQYQAALDAYNAKKASRGGLLGGIGTVGGAIVGGMLGGPMGVSIGAKAGGSLGAGLGG